MTFNSKIYLGKVEHTRCAPVVHRFDYPFYCWGLDLSELEELDKKNWFFGYNRRALFSLWDRDYFPGYNGSIRERLLCVLRQRGVEEVPARTEIITSLRFFGYVFNPVTFFRCFDAKGEVLAFVAQVNNTFNETHLYVLSQQISPRNSPYIKYRSPKKFHVSPFNDMQGDYIFYLRRAGPEIDVRVNIVRHRGAVLSSEVREIIAFTSRLSGKPREINAANLGKTLVEFPFSAVLTTPRILRESIRLYFAKGLKVYTKPIASSEMTVKAAPPGIVQRLCLRIGRRFLSRIRQGFLEVVFPDGSVESFGQMGQSPRAKVFVKNYDFFVRSVLSGDIGFGESYIDQQWEADDLTALLCLFLENEEALDDRSIAVSYLGRIINRGLHLLRPNSRRGSRKNVGAHYDLSNHLFRTFLDSSMTYSCAQFAQPQQDLEEAQQNKINSIIQKAQLKPEDHVLEIGCGWGSFAIAAAKQVGCRVTGITLSKEQREYALERVRAEGLVGKVEILLTDYRELQGQYDKIVSIEMLEAVGHKYLGRFFALCDRLLKPNGVVVLQVITFPDYRYRIYRLGCDWIQKYIFPGGLCPSLTAICNAVTRSSRLVVQDVENIGVHYATTLRQWRNRFVANFHSLDGHGFDEEFARIWSYYLSYCEAGFASRNLGTLQIVLSRVNNKLLES